MKTIDTELRAAERELAASPGDREVRLRVAGAYLRAGRRADAFTALHLRLADAPGEKLGGLTTSARHSLAAVLRQARADLDAVDPLLLASSFPQRPDGRYRLNATRFLRRYHAHLLSAPSQELVLVAWTPGTSSLWERPEDRGRRVVTVGLDTRSTFHATKLLPEARWRRPG